MDNKSKQELLDEIENALGAVDFGSVEIYVSDKKVTQITVRKIKKTSIEISQNREIGAQETAKENLQTDTPNKFFTVRARFRRSE